MELHAYPISISFVRRSYFNWEIYTECPRRKGQYSNQKSIYMWFDPNGFRARAISLHISKIVDKKEILRTVSNTGIYCSSYQVGTVYLVLSTGNISALCNSCEDMACYSSEQCLGNRSE
jgi:hypothetical protein